MHKIGSPVWTWRRKRVFYISKYTANWLLGPITIPDLWFYNSTSLHCFALIVMLNIQSGHKGTHVKTTLLWRSHCKNYINGIMTSCVERHYDVMPWEFFRLAGPLWWESIGQGRIPLTGDQWCRALMLSLLLSWTRCGTNSCRWLGTPWRPDGVTVFVNGQ